MAGIDCIKRLVEQSEGRFTPDSAKQFINDIEKEARDHPTLSFEDALKLAKSNRLTDARNGQQVAIRKAYENIKTAETKTAVLDKVGKIATELQKRDSKLSHQQAVYEGWRAHLGGIAESVTGAKDSMYAMLKNLKGKYANTLAAELRAAGLDKFARHPDNQLAIAKEMAYQNTKDKSHIEAPGSSEEIKKIARLNIKMQNASMAERNMNGASIARRDGYIDSQYHDPLKIADITREEYVRRLTDPTSPERVNVEKMERYGIKDIPGLIGQHYDRVLNGEASSESYNVARGMSHSRTLIFDPEQALAYDKAFGRGGNLQANIIEGLANDGRQLTLLKGLGAQPKENLEAWTRNLTDWQRGRLNNLLKEIDGSLNDGGHPTLQKATNWLKGAQTLVTLGAGRLAHIPDPVFKSLELQRQGAGFWSSLRTTMKDYGHELHLLDRSEQELIASKFGVFHKSYLGSLEEQTSSKMLETTMFFNAQGNYLSNRAIMDHVDTAMELAKNSGKTWDKLPAPLQSLLKQYNFTEQHWDAARAATSSVKEDGLKVILPDAVQDSARLTDGRLKEILGDVSQDKLDSFREQVADMVRGYVIDRHNHMQVIPTAPELAKMHQGIAAGTPLGAANRLFLQYKQYPLTIISKAWGDAIRGGVDGKVNLSAVAQLAIGCSVMGYVAQSVRQMTHGETPGGFSAQALVYGGGGGLIADTLKDIGESSLRHSAIAGLLGPTAGKLDSIAGATAETMRGDKAAPADRFQVGRSLVPFGNNPVISPLMNWLILNHVHAYAQPNYAANQQRTAQKNGQSYFIPPGTRAF